MKEGFRGYDTAHAMADKDSTYTGVDSWRRSPGQNFQIDDNILKPASNG